MPQSVDLDKVILIWNISSRNLNLNRTKI